MLKENTGSHFLDSGGAYGRNYERNQARDFSQEPACQVDIQGDEAMISYNLYHYLNNYLEYTPECAKLEAQFKAMADLPENRDTHWLALMETFADRFTNFGTTNTYNEETILSQVIQYTEFSLTDDEYDVYILLQIHGGCDVRGGYTAPRIFKVVDRDYFIMGRVNVDAWCPKCHNNWMSDDGGFHWWFDGCSAPGPEFTIKDDKALCSCGHEVTFSVREDI